MATKIAVGNARDKLRLIHNESINCSVTSPAYWMLRNYHAGPGEIGREPTIRQYIDNLLQVIDEIYRVLMPHGTLWLNLGDTYSTQAGTHGVERISKTGPIHDVNNGDTVIEGNGMPPKSLCLIPYRVAIAMVDRGWIVRNAVIWHKPDGMPESVQDRFTVDYEPVFFCAKNPQYYFKQQLRPDAENTLKDKDRPKAPLKRAKNLVVPGRTTHGMHIDRASWPQSGRIQPGRSQSAVRVEDTYRSFPRCSFRGVPGATGGDLHRGWLPPRRHCARSVPWVGDGGSRG